MGAVHIEMYNIEGIKNKIFTGDSKEVLKLFPSNSIDLMVTSPPYHAVRNYQHTDQIGREETVQEYIDNLFTVFKECKRVIKKTGSMWINIADSYNEKKSLKGVPERLRLRLQDELDLVCRNVIIWYKPSCMPRSVKNRFTVDYEVFMWFVKDPERYYFNTQYEPMKTFYKDLEYNGQAKKDYSENGVQNPSDIKKRMLEKYKSKIKYGGNKFPNQVDNNTYSGNVWQPNPNLERIKRCVWSLNTGNSKEHHFATYPEHLIGTPIKACTNTTDKSLVLDPFLGSGTTAIKAQKMERSYVGIELNQKYVDIITRRLNSMITSYLNNTLQ